MLKRILVGLVMVLAWIGSMGVSQSPQNQAPKPTPEVVAILERASQAAKANRNDEAQRIYDEALTRARDISDAAGCASALKRSGDLYGVMEDQDRARQRYEQAVPFFRQVGDGSGEAWTLRELCGTRFMTGRRKEALEAGEAALALFRKLGDRKGEATVLTDLAQLVPPGQAKEYLESALKVFRELGDKDGQARILAVLGNNVYGLSDPKKAITCLEEALVLARLAKDPDVEANVLMYLGKHTEDLAKATPYFIQALELYGRRGNKRGQAVALTNFGNSLSRAGRKHEALERHEQALEIKRALGDRNGQAISLANIAGIDGQIGEPEKALELLKQSQALFEETEDASGVAHTMRISAGILTDLGEHETAIGLCQRAAGILAKWGDKRGEADAIMIMGHSFGNMERAAEAADCFDQALSIFEQIQNKLGQANALREVGVTMGGVGQTEKALEYLRRSQALMRDLRDESGLGFASKDVADVLIAQGRYVEALPYYQLARSMHRQVGNKEDEVAAVADIAQVRIEAGQYAEALKLADEALSIIESAGGNYDRARLHYSKGLALQGLRKWDEAVAEIGVSSKLFEDWGDRPSQIDALARTGEVLQSSGRAKDAERKFREATKAADAVGASIGGERVSAHFLVEATQRAYGGLTALLWRQGRIREAFESAQGAKARALLALVGRTKLDLTKALTPNEADQEQALRHHANYLTSQISSDSGVSGEATREARKSLKSDVREAEQRLQWFYDNLYAHHPELNNKRPAKPVSAAEVARAIQGDTAILEYADLSAGNRPAELKRTILFVVTRANGAARVTSHELRMHPDQLPKAVAALRDSCSDRRRPWRSMASALYKELVAPAEKELDGKKRLIVCPDGPLWELPFQVLVNESNQTLIDRYEVDYAYSASAVLATLTGARVRTNYPLRDGPLVIVNPDFGTKADAKAVGRTRASREVILRGCRLASLPGTQREANAIRRLFPASVTFAGAMAQEESVKKQASRYRYLHFGTHGFLIDSAPMLSSLVLARPAKGSIEDGFLTAMEISSMDLHADLAVLSACNTARGEVRRGEGLVGFSWALQVAGARSQVLAKWALNDVSTATLMADFYGRLKNGEAKGAALRAAALSLKRDGIYTHPYYWAPFVLVGDWRK